MTAANDLSRRRFLQVAAAGVTAGVLPACGPTSTEPQSPVSFTPGQPLPWINWAGNQSCLPSARPAPASEDELAQVLKNAKGVGLLAFYNIPIPMPALRQN